MKTDNEEQPIWRVGLAAYYLALENRGANFEAFANAVIAEHERRKAEPVKAEWRLTDPPEGEQWHRTDWTQDMLPDGYRPLLHGEKREMGDSYKSSTGAWECANIYPMHLNEANGGWIHHRTTRPLPVKPDPFAAEKAAFAAGEMIQCRVNPSFEWSDCTEEPMWSPECEYRVKPDPVLVPLGPEDVKCGDCLFQPDFLAGVEMCINGVFADAVSIVAWGSDGLLIEDMNWQRLHEKWLINRNDGKGWVACSKERVLP